MKPRGPHVKCSSQNIWNTDNRIVSQIFISLQNAHKCDEKREVQVLERKTQSRHYLQKA